VIFRYGRHDFYRRGNVLIGQRKFWGILRPAEAVDRFVEERSQQIPGYTSDYIEQVYAAQDRETVRGATPRYWEDVQIGENLVPVVRGPHTAMESIAWTIAAIGQNFWVSDRLFRYVHDHSGWGIWDPQLKIWRNDHDPFFERGRHGGYGAQRVSWMEMVISNWMGDEGFLWRLRAENRLYGGYGWVYWCYAVVRAKYTTGAHACVVIDGRVQNQDGKVVDRAEAVVILPSRAHGPMTFPAPGESAEMPST
jgi:hypothetical protein